MDLTSEATEAAEELFREYIDNLYFDGYALKTKYEDSERYQFELTTFLKSHSFNFSQI